MECPKCRHENPEDARFCNGCGQNLKSPSEPITKELNGISAEEYLERARSMFEEMDLQWDLDELDRVSL